MQRIEFRYTAPGSKGKCAVCGKPVTFDGKIWNHNQRPTKPHQATQ